MKVARVDAWGNHFGEAMYEEGLAENFGRGMYGKRSNGLLAGNFGGEFGC